MPDEAEWVVNGAGDWYLLFHPQLNVVCSGIGYLLFALIIYACHRQRVLWKRMHDVFLILIFAFFTDFLQMRMHLFFIFNMPRTSAYWKHLPTTVGACTLGMWVFFVHFMITYVEAIVSVYRFLVRVLGKVVSVSFIYIGVGAILAVQASILFESFLYGTPEQIVDFHSPIPVYCTKAYMLDGPVLISKLATAATMAIAPILSLIMMFKRSKREMHDSGVSAFIFLSSSSLCFMVYLYLFLLYADVGKYIPEEYWDDVKYVLLGAYTVQYLRFPLLCLTAIIVVGDIRKAVIIFPLRAGRWISGRKTTPDSITNEAFLE